jgi:photosystem II stability/assembly factor-like uncharacterized protein
MSGTTTDMVTWMVGSPIPGYPFNTVGFVMRDTPRRRSSDLLRLPFRPPGSLHAVAAVGPSEMWTVGESGTILHHVDGMWRDYSDPSLEATLYGVDMVSSTEGWAAGSGGTMLRYVASPTRAVYLPCTLRDD